MNIKDNYTNTNKKGPAGGQNGQTGAPTKRRKRSPRKGQRKTKSRPQPTKNLTYNTIQSRQRAQTSSTEIMTDSDARAGPRNSKEPKSRRESQESIQELDSQGRKVPTNKHRNRRH